MNLFTSFEQYNKNGLDGDIARINMPNRSFSKIYSDPVGVQAAFYHERYNGAGRWFCFESEYLLFHQGYFLVNYFNRDKIESLFLTATLFQWVCHWLMVIVLAFYVNMSKKIRIWNIIFASALILPFFQFGIDLVNVGIINHAISYTFFYAFPMTLWLIFFYPFFRMLFYENTKFSKSIFQITTIFLLGLLIVFSSPLIAPLGIIFGCILILLFFLKGNNSFLASDLNNILIRIKNIPVTVRILLPVFMVVCIYDFYLGKFNTENITDLSLKYRFHLMLNGIPNYLINFGLPYCFGLLIMVYFFSRKYFPEILKTSEVRFLKFISFGVILFLFLLPLGGYRSYRPNIWSNDLTMPLTIFLIIIIVAGSIFLLKQLGELPLKIFAFLFFTTLLIYWCQNFPAKNNRSEQQQMLEILARQKAGAIVCLPFSSSVLSWGKVDDPANSTTVSDFLYSLGITENHVLFYQK